MEKLNCLLLSILTSPSVGQQRSFIFSYVMMCCVWDAAFEGAQRWGVVAVHVLVHAGSATRTAAGDLGTTAPSVLASGTGAHLGQNSAPVQLPMPVLNTGSNAQAQLIPNNPSSSSLAPASQQLDPNIPTPQPAAVHHVHSRKRKQQTPAQSAAASLAGSAAEKRARPTTRSINGIRVPPVPLSPPAPQVQAPRRRTITDQKAADILIDIARNSSQTPTGRSSGGAACGRNSAAGRGGGHAAFAGIARGRRTTLEADIPVPVTAEAAREGRANIGGERDTLFLALRKHLPKAAGNVQISQMSVTNHVLKVVCTLHDIHDTYLTKADGSEVVEKLNIAVPATRGPAVTLPTFGLANGNREGMMLVTMLSCYVPTGETLRVGLFLVACACASSSWAHCDCVRMFLALIQVISATVHAVIRAHDHTAYVQRGIQSKELTLFYICSELEEVAS